MNIAGKFSFLLCIACLVVGCESSRDSTRSTFSSLGVIQTRDIYQADACRKDLPNQIGLPESQVEVKPGSGVIVVTIDRGKDPRTKEYFVGKVEEYVKKTNLGPIKLRVYPEDEMIWSKATIIEKQK